VNPESTRSQPHHPHTHTFDPDLDAGLAAAFGPDLTPGGWSHPPLLRDDPSDHGPVVQPASPEMPRAHPERYQLLGELARGGMGTILKGRDPDLGRDLAVKVLRADLAGRPAAVQRFVEEAQVGGQLQHPGVVPVYDLGRFADGRPYFAMKLVKGRTLADHLTDRPDPATDRGKFLQIFLQVCQTVAFAHSRGVIHRDLKPSNVMVGSFGEVLVMDWGLAKVLPRGGLADETRATQASRERGRPERDPTEIRTVRAGSGSDTAAGSVLGTPGYMPPEQAGGEVDKLDERADVFGLGAILCTVLTGTPPYQADTPEAVRLMAIRGQVADAFARLDGCGADAELVTLCRRCLSPERDARPRHAGEVAAAVESHLSDVEARARQAEMDRAAAEVRTREERKRRRVQLALAAAVGLLLLGGGAFGWWQDRQAAERKREQAEFAAEQARVETERAADERARRGRNAEAVAGLLGRCEDALGADDAEKAGLALEVAERRAAEGGADGLRDRLGRCRSDLDVLRALDRIDELRWTMKEGQFSDSRKVAEEWSTAFARYGIVPGSTPPDDAARRIAGSLLRDRLLQALDEWHFRFPSEGLAAILRAADPDPFRDAVRAACAARSRSQVRALGDRPEALDQPGRFAAAMGDIDFLPAQRRKQLLVAALGRRPGDLGLLMTLGYLHPPDTRGEKAVEREKWFRAAVAVRPGCVAAHNNLGNALRDRGDRDGALAEFREAIRLDPKLALPHINLGNVLADRGDLNGALAEFRQAARLEPKFALPHVNLGGALHKMGDVDGAVAELREAVRLEPRSALVHNHLGLILVDRGDTDGAVAAYREAIRLEPRYAYAHNNLGVALAGRGDQDGAVAAYREAARLDPQYANPHYNAALVLIDRGDTEGAVAEFREAIRLEPRHAFAHYSLGNALRERGDLPGAEAAFREAIRIDPGYPEPHCNLGLLLLDRKGRPAEALPLLRRGHELGSQRPGWKYPSEQWVADCERALAAQEARTAPPPREVKR
jgi:tetratricopeptide (TPR) repeat protein